MSDAHKHDHINCQATLTRLYPYLDRELDETELAAVRAHLGRCGPCAKLFRFEDNILTLIGERLAHTQAPPDLRNRITRLCSERGTR
jgi:mycothiol system anti-sigma-R factor